MFLFVFNFISFKIFSPIYTATEIIIPYGIHPFDICSKNPELWNIIKTTYIFTSQISFFLINHLIYTRIILKIIQKFKNLKLKIKNSNNKTNMINKNTKLNFNPSKKDLNLKIGKDEKDNIIFIPESG